MARACLRTLNSVNRSFKVWQLIKGSPSYEMKSPLENGAARQLVRTRSSRLAPLSRLLAALAVVVVPLLASRAPAQMEPELQMGTEAGSELRGSGPMASPNPSSNELSPIPNLQIPRPMRGAMLASPPYGSAPLAVGFSVLATDPEGLGFLSYSWNFGDGSVSSLPPESYIFHIYQKPGSYVCELTMTTIDGRKFTVFQGIIVQPSVH
jgi:PKD domain